MGLIGRYVPGLRSANAERVRFGQEFHRALAEGEFVLHYQPQVSIMFLRRGNPVLQGRAERRQEFALW